MTYQNNKGKRLLWFEIQNSNAGCFSIFQKSFKVKIKHLSQVKIEENGVTLESSPKQADVFLECLDLNSVCFINYLINVKRLYQNIERLFQNPSPLLITNQRLLRFKVLVNKIQIMANQKYSHLEGLTDKQKLAKLII